MGREGSGSPRRVEQPNLALALYRSAILEHGSARSRQANGVPPRVPMHPRHDRSRGAQLEADRSRANDDSGIGRHRLRVLGRLQVRRPLHRGSRAAHPRGAPDDGRRCTIRRHLERGGPHLRTTIVISSLEPGRSITWSSAGTKARASHSNCARSEAGQPSASRSPTNSRAASRARSSPRSWSTRSSTGQPGRWSDSASTFHRSRHVVETAGEATFTLRRQSSRQCSRSEATQSIDGARPPLPCEGSKGPCTATSISQMERSPRSFLTARRRKLATAEMPAANRGPFQQSPAPRTPVTDGKRPLVGLDRCSISS